MNCTKPKAFSVLSESDLASEHANTDVLITELQPGRMKTTSVPTFVLCSLA